MNWNIYDVNEKIDYLLEKYMNPVTGELADEANAQIEELGLERSTLIKGLALAVKRNMVYISGMEAEKKRLDSRIASAQKSSNWLLQQVQNNITEGETIKEEQFELKWTTSTKLIIDEFERDAEKDYKDKNWKMIKKFIKKVTTVTYTFDKPALSNFLKAKDKDGRVVNFVKGMGITKSKNLKIK